MKKFFVYDEVIENSKPIIYFKLNDAYKGIKVDTSYLDHHNDICPTCLKKLVVDEMNYIRDVKLLTSFYDFASRTVYVFGICTTCEEEKEKENTTDELMVVLNQRAKQFVLTTTKNVEVS